LLKSNKLKQTATAQPQTNNKSQTHTPTTALDDIAKLYQSIQSDRGVSVPKSTVSLLPANPNPEKRISSVNYSDLITQTGLNLTNYFINQEIIYQLRNGGLDSTKYAYQYISINEDYFNGSSDGILDATKLNPQQYDQLVKALSTPCPAGLPNGHRRLLDQPLD
jgi:hypothetical protein